jgi:autotransporter-associated beta strand protein
MSAITTSVIGFTRHSIRMAAVFSLLSGGSLSATIVADWRFDNYGDPNTDGSNGSAVTALFPRAQGALSGGDLTPFRDYSGNRHHGGASGTLRVTYQTPLGTAGIYNTTGVLGFVIPGTTYTKNSGAGANFDFGDAPVNMPLLSPGGESRTLEFLVNFDSRAGVQDILQWRNTPTTNGAWVRSDATTGGGSIRVLLGSQNAYFVTPAVKDSDWHALAVVVDRDAGQLRVYMDGVQLSTTTAATSLDISGQAAASFGGGADRIEFGRVGSATGFRGSLDRMVLSSGALAPGSFVLSVPAPGADLTWVGTAAGGTWDLDATAHWIDGSSNPATFGTLDSVTFDDSGLTGLVAIDGESIIPANVTFNNATLDYTVSGSPWAGPGTLTKSGAGTTTLLVDPANIGGTTITSGILKIGNGGTAGSPGIGAITNDGTLAIDRADTFVLVNAISGTGTLSLDGPGTVIIRGNKTYTGPTHLNQGILRVDGALESPVTVASGAILAAGPATGTGTADIRQLTLNSGSRSRFRLGFNASDSVRIAAPDGLAISGPHSIDITAADNWLAGDNFVLFTYEGTISGDPADFQLGTAPHGTYTIVNDPGLGEVYLIVDAVDSLLWKGNSASPTLWDVNQTANWSLASNNSPAPYFESDQVRFDGSAVGTIVSVQQDVMPSDVEFEFDSPVAYQLTGPGGIAGATGLRKLGTGTLTLANPNRYTGPTSIDEGILRLTDGGSPGTGLITNLGAIEVDNSTATLTLANAFSGSGGLVKSGNGTLVLAGPTAAFNSGDVTVNGGTLHVGNQEVSIPYFSQAIPRTITVNSGATLVFLYRNSFGVVGSTPTSNLVIDGGTVSSSSHEVGTVTTLQNPVLRNGATIEAGKSFGPFGTYQLQGTVTVEGPAPSQITGAEGVVTVGNATNASGITIFEVDDMGTDADLTVEAVLRNSGNFNNNIGNIGGLTKTGKGTMLLTAANIHTGPTRVAEGTLRITGSLAGSATSVVAGATLGGNGDIGGAVTIEGGATHALAVAANPAAQITRTIGGVLDLQQGNILRLSAAAPPAPGTYILATANGGIDRDLGEVILPEGVSGSVVVVDNSITLTIGGGVSDYDTWAGLSGFNLVGGPEDDDDGDGLTNFAEYAFGLNPTSASSVSPVTAPDKTGGSFTYTRRKPSLTGLTYSYESSTTLVDWPGFTPDSEVSDNGDPVETITVAIPEALLAEPSLFLRVKAHTP